MEFGSHHTIRGYVNELARVHQSPSVRRDDRAFAVTPLAATSAAAVVTAGFVWLCSPGRRRLAIGLELRLAARDRWCHGCALVAERQHAVRCHCH